VAAATSQTASTCRPNGRWEGVPRHRLVCFALAVVLALIATSCRSTAAVDDSARAASSEAGTSEPTAEPASGSQTLRELFTAATYPTKFVEVRAADLEAGFAAAGYDYATVCADADTFLGAYIDAFGHVNMPSLLPRRSDKLAEGFKDLPRSYGIDYCDLNGSLVAEVPTVYSHIDTSWPTIVGAVEADERWAEFLTFGSVGNYQLIDWGDDTRYPTPGPSTVRVDATGGQLAVDDSIAVRTFGRSRLGDAIGPDVQRLLDRTWLAAAIEPLLERDAYWLMATDRPWFTNAVGSYQPGWEPTEQDNSDVSEGLPPWLAMAFGQSAAQGKGQLTIAIVFSSPASAAQGAEHMQLLVDAGVFSSDEDLPYRDRFQIKDLEIREAVVLAELSSPDPQHSIVSSVERAVFQGESLFSVASPRPSD